MRNCFSVLYCISWVERKLQQYIALKQLAIDDDGGGGGEGDEWKSKWFGNKTKKNGEGNF